MKLSTMIRASSLATLHASSFATALAALLLAPAAFAQGGSAAAPVPNRVAVLNVTAAVFSSAEGKQGLAELQSQFAPRQTELQNLMKQIEDARRRATEGQSTLPDDEKTRLGRQIDAWTRTGQRKQQELEDDFNLARNELGERILRKLDAVVEKFAKEGNFAVVVDVSAQNVPYWSPQIDITQDIIRAYDATNPVGAAAQPPAQPRPTAQPGQPRPKPPGQ